jgi:hypothetical protein
MARTSETCSTSVGNNSKFSVVYELRGYHAYMKDWKPKLHEVLYGVHEKDNTHDPHCIAFCQEDVDCKFITIDERAKFRVVGHLPIELSNVAYHFMQRNGTLVAQVQDVKQHRSNKAEGKY